MREFPEVEEFRVETCERQAMRELKLIIEPNSNQSSAVGLQERVSSLVRERIGIRPEVELVAPGSLPRFELRLKGSSSYSRLLRTTHSWSNGMMEQCIISLQHPANIS